MRIVTIHIRSLLIVLAALLVGCDSGPAHLRFVAPAAELDREIAQDLAAVLEKGTEFHLDFSGEGLAGDAALDMLIAGEADIALVSNYLPYREGISMVMPLYPTVLHLIYRDGRDTSSTTALFKDATVYAREEGSASRLVFERIVERLGLTADEFTYLGSDAAQDEISPDIVVVFAPITPQRMAVFDDYQLYSIGVPSEVGLGSVVDATTLLNPALRPFIIPATTYGETNATPIVTVAVDKVLVVRPNLAPSLVYDLINAIRRARPALAAGRPGLFSELGDDFDISKSTFVLHAGSQDFLQRAEPTVYERYSGVAEVLVTLLIAMISATLAIFRILKIRRKNRIDEFYSAAIKIRNSLSSEPTAEERNSAVNEIRELQNHAFEKLVDEKLAADESFRIFITLTNDILEQTGKK
jgi:TRAP-type uncharacterized transport system substrate-binding protein